MGLDIFSTDRSETHFLTVDLDALDALEEAFAVLKSKTGIYIDPYKTTRISPDHGKILVSHIEAHFPSCPTEEARHQVSQFVSTLRASADENRWLLAVGD